VIGAPADNRLLDLIRGQFLCGSPPRESGKLLIRGKTEGDELLGGKIGDQRVIGGGQKCGKAEALFKANDPVLDMKGVNSALFGDEDEQDREEDPPESDMGEVAVAEVVEDEGENQIEEQERHDDEVVEGIQLRVFLVALLLGHAGPFKTVAAEQ
jgi:hypothetical protein